MIISAKIKTATTQTTIIVSFDNNDLEKFELVNIIASTNKDLNDFVARLVNSKWLGNFARCYNNKDFIFDLALDISLMEKLHAEKDWKTLEQERNKILEKNYWFSLVA